MHCGSNCNSNETLRMFIMIQLCISNKKVKHRCFELHTTKNNKFNKLLDIAHFQYFALLTSGHYINRF